MLQVTPSSTIYMASTHIDFRKGTDGLCAICRNQLAINPLDGAIFLFYNRLKTSIKILAYDGQGFWLCHKRLSSGRFAFWPDGQTPTCSLQACELQVLLMGGDPTRANAAPAWRRLSLAA